MADEDRLNVLKIGTDQHHCGSTGCYDAPAVDTFTIDRLAGRGDRS